jgi:hypothetical protein
VEIHSFPLSSAATLYKEGKECFKMHFGPWVTFFSILDSPFVSPFISSNLAQLMNLLCSDTKRIYFIYAFNYPWTVTGVHSLCSFVTASVAFRRLVAGPEKKLTRGQETVLLMFSALYTINIVVSNASMKTVSLPLHQLVRRYITQVKLDGQRWFDPFQA